MPDRWQVTIGGGDYGEFDDLEDACDHALVFGADSREIVIRRIEDEEVETDG